MYKIHGECLQEECAEVIQAMSKIFRFGLHNENPYSKETNKEQLEKELDQLMAMITIVRREYGLDNSRSEYYNKEQKHYGWIEEYPQTDTIKK